MKQKTVYVTLSQFCEVNEEPRKILHDAGFHVLENKTGRRIKKGEIFEALKDVDAVLAAVEPYDADLLERLPKLRLISRCGAGTDTIDLAAAKKLGIEVMVTRDEIVEPVAQMTVGMILALARNFALHLRDFREGLWEKKTGFLLSELAIGFVGFGKIARKVLEYLKPFGPKILIFDPFLDKKNLPKEVEVCSFHELLARADLVSLHAARSPEEGPLFGDKEFSKMKPGSFFVNTARGYLVNEEALKKALDSSRLAGAALDVFEEEPYHGPLAKYPNVLLTPHVATLTRASRAAMELKCAQNVIDFFERMEKR